MHPEVRFGMHLFREKHIRYFCGARLGYTRIDVDSRCGKVITHYPSMLSIRRRCDYRPAPALKTK
jgi:hypothetical protein